MKELIAAFALLVMCGLSSEASAQIVPGQQQPMSVTSQAQLANQLRWQFEGTRDFARFHTSQVDLAVDQNRPYIVFSDADENSKISVMTRSPNGQGWVHVGPPGFSAGEGRFPKIAIGQGEIFVAFQDRTPAGYEATVMRYNSVANTWDYVGQRAFSPGNARSIDLEVFKGRPFISYNGYRLYNPSRSPGPVVQAFNRATGQWDMLGSYGFGFSGTVRWTDLEIVNDEPFLSIFLDGQGGTPNRVYVYRYDRAGNSWSTMGTGFASGLTMMPDLEIEGEDIYLGMQKVHKFNNQQGIWQEYSVNLSPFDMEVRNQKIEGTMGNSMPPYWVRVRELSSPSGQGLASHSPVGQSEISIDSKAAWLDLEFDPQTGKRFLAVPENDGQTISVMTLRPISLTPAQPGAVLSRPAPSDTTVRPRPRTR